VRAALGPPFGRSRASPVGAEQAELAADVSEEVSSCETAAMGPRLRGDSVPTDVGTGFGPVRGGDAVSPWWEGLAIKREVRASGGCLGTERR
jgi:hypothetical protein